MSIEQNTVLAIKIYIWHIFDNILIVVVIIGLIWQSLSVDIENENTSFELEN